MWDLLRDGQNGKNDVAGPALYLFQELLITNLFASPIWIVGLIWLLANSTARFLGLHVSSYSSLEMIVLHGKALLPRGRLPDSDGGGKRTHRNVDATRARPARGNRRCDGRRVGLFFVPFSLPVLSETAMIDYGAFVGRTLHISRSTMQTEHGRHAALPEDWADMHGWPELASGGSTKLLCAARAQSATRRQSSRAITARLRRSTFSARYTACRRRFRDITTIGCGARTDIAAT